MADKKTNAKDNKSKSDKPKGHSPSKRNSSKSTKKVENRKTQPEGGKKNGVSASVKTKSSPKTAAKPDANTKETCKGANMKEGDNKKDGDRKTSKPSQVKSTKGPSSHKANKSGTSATAKGQHDKNPSKQNINTVELSKGSNQHNIKKNVDAVKKSDSIKDGQKMRPVSAASTRSKNSNQSVHNNQSNQATMSNLACTLLEKIKSLLEHERSKPKSRGRSKSSRDGQHHNRHSHSHSKQKKKEKRGKNRSEGDDFFEINVINHRGGQQSGGPKQKILPFPAMASTGLFSQCKDHDHMHVHSKKDSKDTNKSADKAIVHEKSKCPVAKSPPAKSKSTKSTGISNGGNKSKRNGLGPEKSIQSKKSVTKCPADNRKQATNVNKSTSVAPKKASKSSIASKPKSEGKK